MVEESAAKQEAQVQSLGWKVPLEKENGNPLKYSCLGNPTYRPSRPHSMGSQRVGHNLTTKQQQYRHLAGPDQRSSNYSVKHFWGHLGTKYVNSSITSLLRVDLYD